MSAIKTVLAELLGLFIDDGALALAAIALIAAVAAAVRWAELPGLEGGLLILAGCLLILAESLTRAARAKRRGGG
ncbi:hypothetical protein FFK22_004355 [Mycobacterium sp. KBS0706]|uniref:hypothetical protein n=1 Tax=Mycobacterium sp. KBS0706 TaxID=2578109 RepID=UPI00110FF27C|nr:hypothetical protein [Mycobacterium sp. KBS0706]TSD90041.1 hypothetical protein FFK22_004355 [Mycobacterium sp. KBS0706]